MTVNLSALSDFLSTREEEGFSEEIEASFIDRIVYTGNGVAKVRELNEEDCAQEIYELAERNLEVLQEKDIDHINTTHAVLEYNGSEKFVVFQPYTVEPEDDAEEWSQTIVDAYQSHGISLDPKLENFGVQYDKSGEEIRRGYRDISDPVSVHAEDKQLAEELAITHEDNLDYI